MKRPKKITCAFCSSSQALLAIRSYCPSQLSTAHESDPCLPTLHERPKKWDGQQYLYLQFHFLIMLQVISKLECFDPLSCNVCKDNAVKFGALFWSAKRNDGVIWVYDRARTPEPGLEWWFEHFTCSGSSESGNKNISLGRNTLTFFFFFVPCPNVWFKTKYVPFKTIHESNTLLDHSSTSSISFSSNIPGIFTLECPIADDCSWRRTV